MNFIVENLQIVVMAGAALVSGIYALTGFQRETLEEGETKITYQGGRLRRNLAVAGILVGLSASLAFVPRGYEGVVYDVNGGVQPESLSDGVHIVFPFKEHVTNVNTQVQVYVHNNENVWQHTLDTQEIRVPVAVNYRVADASYVYENIRGDIATTVIEPAVLRALRTVIGSYELEKIAENQNKINAQISDNLNSQFATYGISVVYVSIEDTIARPGIIEAIEREKIAERDKITAQHNRDIAQTNAEAVVRTAEGDAEARRINAEARQDEQQLLGMTSTEYVWYSTWDGVLPTTLLGEDGGNFIVTLP